MYIYLYMNCALQTKVDITIKQQLMLHTSYSLFPSSPVLRIHPTADRPGTTSVTLKGL